MRHIAAAFLLIIAGAADGEAWRPDAEAQLDRCLEAAPDRSAAAECFYIVNDACIAATGDDTTIGMAECLMAETAVWDDRLNALWPEALAMARELDAADAGAAGAYEQSLRAAQRAWIAFRDADCAWAYQRWSSGSIRVLFGASCQLESTADRVLDMREWLLDGM